MPIQVHDTLTGGKRELVPLRPGQLGLYACGPTVYDYSHLGHARCYVVWDVVVRHLRRLSSLFLDRKEFSGAHGLQVSDDCPFTHPR